MKISLIPHIKAVLGDRYLVFVLSLLILLTIIFCIYVALSLNPSELQVVTHYTTFGSTNFYRDKWYYLINFILFGVVSLAGYIVLTGKIFVQKGRELAIPFAWLGIIVMFVAMAVAYQVLKIAALS